MTAAGVTSLGVATASLASGDQNIGKEYIYRKLIVKDQEIYQKIGELLWSEPYRVCRRLFYLS
jgi:hypothetical protein